MSQSRESDDPLQDLKDIVGDSSIVIAIAGAIVSVLTGFIPFSPLFGGALAGWLVREDERRGAMVGGLSGLIISLPFGFFFIPIFGLVFFDVGFSGLLFVPILLFIAFIGLCYTVGISALGGYFGVRFYQRRVVEGTGTSEPTDATLNDDWGTDHETGARSDDESSKHGSSKHGRAKNGSVKHGSSDDSGSGDRDLDDGIRDDRAEGDR